MPLHWGCWGHKVYLVHQLAGWGAGGCWGMRHQESKVIKG